MKSSMQKSGSFLLLLAVSIRPGGLYAHLPCVRESLLPVPWIL